MGFLSKLFGKGDVEDEADLPINLDLDLRRTQLTELEGALDELARTMREVASVDNPGWRGRVNEYGRLAGEAMMQRKQTPTREGLLDLSFEIRPVFTGDVPAGFESLVPLQERVMTLATQLATVMPGER